MSKILEGLEREIVLGEENSKRAQQLYHLLESYNAYCKLLLNAKSEYEDKGKNYQLLNSYGEEIDGLFSLFENDECLRAKRRSGEKSEDRLFLIDDDSLLKINSHYNFLSKDGMYNINCDILRINNAVGRVYSESVYCGDPYYSDHHYEDKDSFGLFYNRNLITPSYELDSQFLAYDDKDIREFLKIQSLDDIYEKITEARDQKVKKLVISKH